MGIGRSGLQLYQHLYQKNFFEKISSVLELGDQEVKPRLRNDLIKFLEAIGKIDPASVVSASYATIGKRPLGKRLFKPNNLPAALFYRWLGVKDYVSIDTNGGKKSLVFDLNEDIAKKYNFTKEYDLVTNHGTIEHIFNQHSCFKNMHNLTKLGGYMLHWLPFFGHINHCFFNYHPQFFIDLALANNYHLVGMWLDVDDSLLVPYTSEVVKEYRRKGEHNLAIFCLIKKLSQEEFKPPFQGKYIEVTKVDAVNGIKFRRPKRSWWRTVLSKLMRMKL